MRFACPVLLNGHDLDCSRDLRLAVRARHGLAAAVDRCWIWSRQGSEFFGLFDSLLLVFAGIPMLLGLVGLAVMAADARKFTRIRT